MSDNIPFDLQLEIIKKVIKSLMQFRSVSKPWKSFIDEFIKSYGARHTQPYSHILILPSRVDYDERFICLVEDDNIVKLKVQKHKFSPFIVSPLLKQYQVFEVIGECHGLLCLNGFHKGDKERMLVIWNPSIGKTFGIVEPILDFTSFNYGFGVCPVTKDPTIVKFIQSHNKPLNAEVFTLSSRVWNVIPSGNLPRQSIHPDSRTQVVTDRFIYWGACEKTINDDGEYTTNTMVVSFDLITKDFKVVDLPHSLTNELLYGSMSFSKLRESLVVYVEGAHCCSVWVMERDSSFTKKFSIGTRVYKLLGFNKNGEPIFELEKGERCITLNVYDPCSQEIKNVGISLREYHGSFMASYKESLLLLDHPDSRIY